MISEQERDWLLVERVQAGDKQAFNLLVNKYQSRLFRLILRIITNPSEAEDVVQETFIKAYRALRHFRGDAAFYTWLYRIALNAAKNALVTRSRRKDTGQLQDDGQEGAVGAVVEDVNSPDAILASRQVAAAINEAMDNLPDVLRMALALREIEGLSYDEIAQIMKCPIGTIRSRIFRARALIALRLDPILEHPGLLSD
jgi:RNA polymerase sigma-70 factor (ECF subfamily)